jgi:aldehyde:ferredoxin oxidoreductase
VTIGGTSADFAGGAFTITGVGTSTLTYTQAGAATTEGNTERVASASIPVLHKYLSAGEWTKLRTTVLAGSGKSPFDLLDAGDPRWMQFIIPYVSANVPGTLGALMGQGPSWIATRIPELKTAMNTDATLHMIKMGHTSHHGIETNGQLGGLVNAVTTCRDANTHTHQNYYGNGLPDSASNPLQRDIAQELTTRGASIFNAADESASGAWAWDLRGTNTPMNRARAAFVAQTVVWYELQNCLTECNYTLPVWASPLKSRNYRGDPTLNAQVLSAITGQAVTHKDLETIGLRVFTLLRALTARYLQQANPGAGADMRSNFDMMAEWQFKPLNTSVNGLDHADWETAKDMLYEQLGWDKATGLPTPAKLAELGLTDLVPTLQAEGVLPR